MSDHVKLFCGIVRFTVMMRQALPYNDYGTWIRSQIGNHVQKLSVDAGLTCPNRDGRLSTEGCHFCDNSAFTPHYCQRGKSVREQLLAGKSFYSRKNSHLKYLAYFQSYTNTYGTPEELKPLYEEALAVEDVAGLVISTRPDCLPPAILNYLEELNRQTFLVVEIGIESTYDATLRHLNRGHDYACSCRAVESLSGRGIRVGGHVILGLPGEDEAMQLSEAEEISRLPLTLLKIHQLQIIRGTKLWQAYSSCPEKKMEVNDYLHLLSHYICRLRKDLVLERFFSSSPLSKVVAPCWGLKPDILNRMLCRYMQENDLWQGKETTT